MFAPRIKIDVFLELIGLEYTWFIINILSIRPMYSFHRLQMLITSKYFNCPLVTVFSDKKKINCQHCKSMCIFISQH